MKLRPNRNYKSNDVVQTPVELAERLVRYFKPSGRILEPCAGEGNFLKYLPQAAWCEISQGRDFFTYHESVDWIITNPPWSQIRTFLNHSFELSHHVAFLMSVNHVWTKARLRDMRSHRFGLKEIVLMDTPPSFPATGFQLGMVCYERDFHGDLTLTTWA